MRIVSPAKLQSFEWSHMKGRETFDNVPLSHVLISEYYCNIVQMERTKLIDWLNIFAV